MATVTINTQNDADFYRSFALEAVNGMPINLSGASMEMVLRRHATDITAVLRLATNTGEIVFIDSANGMFTIEIKQEVLLVLGLGDYEQSNIMTTGTGRKLRVWTGTLTNSSGPTR